jgi:plasmid stabilization system protein ParE
MAVRYFPAAREDIKNTLKWSAENFGRSAAHRYKRLLAVAISELDANPALDHSYEVHGLQPGIRMYHLKHSSSRAALDGRIVKQPRHFIVHGVFPKEIIIVRVLHERMEIPGQLKETL